MISGSCLCGAVRFEMERVSGPFELCHCNRCRKASGSAYMAAVGVRREHFRLISGRGHVRTYDAPLRDTPPPYRVCFCDTCGSCVPDPGSVADWFEVPAGLLDDDPQLRPDKHIFIECKAAWDEISDALPQLDAHALRAARS